MTRLLFAAAATALIAGAASAQDRDVPVQSFDRLEAGGQFDLFVTYGDTPSLRLSGDASKFDQVEIEMRGDKLEISQRRPGWFRSSRPIDVDVHLVAVRIEEAEFSTGIDALVEGVDESVLDLEVNTGARATISGSCGTADYAVSTGGELHARGLECARIEVSSSTAWPMSTPARNRRPAPPPAPRCASMANPPAGASAKALAAACAMCAASAWRAAAGKFDPA